MFPSSLSPGELHLYQKVVTQSLMVRNHFDVLNWLQGDMQRYVPHDILIAAWGDFQSGHIQHDIVSAMTGVRTHNSPAAPITPLLLRLFGRWNLSGRSPYALSAGERGFLLNDSGLRGALGDALVKMRSAMVHGVNDERGRNQCLYVTFSGRERVGDMAQGALGVVLPYIDMALRQVQHLPHQTQEPALQPGTLAPALARSLGLSERESEILHWVSLGKTNPVIGSILGISEFTVKNHLQRLFRKLDVSNRAQAVGRLQHKGLVGHV